MKSSSKNPEGISRRSLLASMGIGGLTLAVTPAGAVAEIAASHSSNDKAASPTDWDSLHYGKWSKDDAGLPCFDADLEHHPAPFAFFCHIMSTGKFGAIADQWGNIKLITSEDGPVCLTPSTWRTRSGMYAMLEMDGQTYSLLHSELQQNKRIRYGTSYVEYEADLIAGHRRLTVKQELCAPPDKDRCSLHGKFTFHNSGSEAITGTLHLQSDVFIRPGASYEDWIKSLRPDCGSGFAVFREASAVLGDVYFLADSEWKGGSLAHSLKLSRQVTLAPGESLTVPVMLGCQNHVDVGERQAKLAHGSPSAARRMWRQRLSTFAVTGLDKWMDDECKWTLGQLLSFEFYNRILDQHYLHLGGYDFFPDPDNPPSHMAYTIREAAENAVVISHFELALAKSTVR